MCVLFHRSAMGGNNQCLQWESNSGRDATHTPPYQNTDDEMNGGNLMFLSWELHIEWLWHQFG